MTLITENQLTLDASIDQKSQRDVSPLGTEGEFIRRHIGPTNAEVEKMCSTLGATSLSELIDEVVPASIRTEGLPPSKPFGEAAVLDRLKSYADKNVVARSFIGMGYYGTRTPNVILRNVLENPSWYTAYTPYQPEISQGRLEALLNFQTMVADLTGLEIANASLLDEGTAAAEAMALCHRVSKSKSNVFFVSKDVHPQTLAVLKTRAVPVGIELVIGDHRTDLADLECFGALFQYPASSGEIHDFSDAIETVHGVNGMVVFAADLLSLTLLKSPGELGVDVAIGTTQRFGIPFFFGGPHAAYMATHEKYKRSLPGRIIGVSRDAQGRPALRMALQTREQHIRRDKATSNVCTAQALLAISAGLYAAYHGPDGLKQIASRVHALTRILAKRLSDHGREVVHSSFFDTLTVRAENVESVHLEAGRQGINFRRVDDKHLGISLDETTSLEDLARILDCFAIRLDEAELASTSLEGDCIPAGLHRCSEYLTNEVFHKYQSETEMLRYLRRLADKDMALDRTMIPLGSCTMKLNATTEMIPISWPGFADIHPLAPESQTVGYREMIEDLEAKLCVATGYDAVSIQPNAGSQGEFAGLLAIQAYHAHRGESQRTVCLIPQSAHGTNPASAKMAGLEIVVVGCDDAGNVDIDDLRAKADQYSEKLSCMMITYPSTHGVFETQVRELCKIVHDHGGQVYIDGANLNAQVGLCEPGEYGGDVSHLNLHKTFCIPHGGGGPGVGPVGVREHLAAFLPTINNFNRETGADTSLDGDSGVGAVSAAPYGSAGILPISWAYIELMGSEGLKRASEVAILNANYVARRLEEHFPILYTGESGRVAHECIVDIRPITESTGISVDDVAKRLMDYGFHAPTMSFPVAGTLMIEPTESESLFELDRFCDAMIQIRQEISEVADGSLDPTDNPLRNAPHTALVVTDDEWEHAYPRSRAAYPVAGLQDSKYWPPVGRLDNAYGDRNLVCSCPSIESYQES